MDRANYRTEHADVSTLYDIGYLSLNYPYEYMLMLRLVIANCMVHGEGIFALVLIACTSSLRLCLF